MIKYFNRQNKVKLGIHRDIFGLLLLFYNFIQMKCILVTRGPVSLLGRFEISFYGDSKLHH